MSFSNPSNENYYQPIDPAEVSMSGGAEPPSFVDSIGLGYDFARAGSEWAYQLNVEDAIAENDRKLIEAGYKPIPLMSRVTEGRNIHAAATDFQSIIANEAAVPGADERYPADNAFKSALHNDIRANKKLIDEARAKRPDLGIQTYEEIDKQVLTGIAKARTPDPRGGWMSSVGQFIGAAGAIVSGANPYAPLEILLGTGVGPNVVTRLATAGAAQAGLNDISQRGARPTLERAGVPISDADMLFGDTMAFIGGALFQGGGELLAGRAGRAAMNNRDGWISDSLRSRKSAAFNPPAMRAPDIVPPEPAPVVPRAPIPSGVPAALERLSGSPAKKSMAEVLDLHSTTPVNRARLAIDLDHTAVQMEVHGAAPQDFIPPTRSLNASHTAVPDVKTWLGPGIGDAPELPITWRRAARSADPLVSETLARQADPETFLRWDKVNTELKAVQKQLDDVSAFHEGAATRKTDALAKHIDALEAKVERARSADGKAKAIAEIDALMKYHEDLTSVRPGGTKPVPIKGYDEKVIADKLVQLTAKRDEIFPDVERAIARADKRYGLPSAQRDALEEKLRPGAADRINGAWAWPKGVRRAKNKAKNPYEVTLLKGPTMEEIFAAKQAELPQLLSPLAEEGRTPGELPIDTATRVNGLERKLTDEETAPNFVKSLKDFIQTLETKTKTQPVPKLKPGEEAIIPSMPAGMTLDDLMVWKGFEVDGKAVTYKEAIEDLLGDAEAHAAFASCSLVP